MTALLLILSAFQNCSMAEFGGKKSGPTYNANGDGHEGKLSIPIDYVKVQSGNGYQNDILFDLTRVLSTNTTLDRVGYYCRSEEASFREGLDIVVSSPANTWSPSSETYQFSGSLPPGVGFSRNSSAMVWNTSGLLQAVANDQPRFVADGNGGMALLLETGATNLLTQSEDIGESDWDATLLSTLFHRSIPSPTGAFNAIAISEIGNGPTRFIRQDATTVNGTYTLSVFIKELSPGRVASVRLQTIPGDTQHCRFDFSNQNLTLFQGAPGTSCNVTTHANGWFRLSITAQVASATIFAGVGLSHPTLGDNYPFAGHPGVLFWGAQLEQGTQASSYIASLATPGVREGDQLILRGGASVLTGANLSLQVNLLNDASQLNFDFGNSQMRVNATNVDFDGPVSNASFANNQALGVQKINTQFSASGFSAYGDGQLVGESSQPGLVVNSVQIAASRSEVVLSELVIEPNVLRKEVMAVSSILDLDPNLSYAVLVVGRENERVQTQPIPLEDLGSDSFTGQSHHFDLLQSSSGHYGFEGSLDDGTLLNDTLLCH